MLSCPMKVLDAPFPGHSLQENTANWKPCGCARTRTRTVSPVRCSASHADESKTGSKDVSFVQCGIACWPIAVVSTRSTRGAVHAWHPRRHHRRLGETWHRRPFSDDADMEIERVSTSSQTTAKSLLAKQPPKLTKEIVLSARAPPTRSMTVSTPPPYTAVRPGHRTDRTGSIVLALLAVFLLFFWKKIVALFRGRGRQDMSGGRWVYDRSLGGKKIYLPQSGRMGESLNPLAGDDRAVEPSTSGRPIQSGPFPTWWVEAPRLYVPQSVKADAQKNANKLIRQLENSKVGGQDYPLPIIVEMYRACETGGVSVSASSSNITLSIFRSGTLAAVNAATVARGTVGAVDPNIFVSCLAEYLQVDVRQAVDIVVGQTAAKARAFLLQAAVDIRGTESRPAVASESVINLARLVSVFPIPPDSAQMDLLISSIQSSTVQEERARIYHIVGTFFPEVSEGVGHMLGEVPVA